MHIDSMEAMPISGRIICTEIHRNFCWDNKTGIKIASQEPWFDAAPQRKQRESIY